MIIGIDMDDTIYDLGKIWVECLNEKYDLNHNASDITQWDMTKVFPELTEEQIYSVFHDRKLWSKAIPFPYVRLYIDSLKSLGHKVYIVTNSHYDTIKYKYEEIIKEKVGFIPWEDVIVIKDKQLLKLDYLVDDNINNLVGDDVSYKGILFTARHNKSIDETRYKNIQRANNWKEVIKILASDKRYCENKSEDGIDEMHDM